MRFNKQELITLATQPSNKFDKEGPLCVTEKQEGFFRKTEGEETSNSHLQIAGSKTHLKRNKSLSCIGGTTKVSLEKWCRLRGNLLFYFKTGDQFSEPQGCIVLEKYHCVKHNEQKEHDGYVFFLEFEDGLRQRFATNTDQERLEWMQAIGLAGYDVKRAQLKYLREQIDKKQGTIHDVDVDMLRLQTGKEIELNEIPICESAISCDNLLCDGNGKPPNPSVVVQVTSSNRAASGWVKYGRTEVIERSSNPQFICTITFRAGDGLNAKSLIRFTAYDVREKVTQTAVPIGWAEVALGVVTDTSRLRIPLRTQSPCGGNAGFITIATCAPDTEKKTSRSPAKAGTEHHQQQQQQQQQHAIGHRRSQSLPPKLGVKLFIPPPSKVSLVFTNPSIHTYRLHSGLGGDISVQEIMLESQLCYIIPQQLLSIWIAREKELLQEISGMGELGGEWRHRQMELLDKHLKLLKDYSQAKQFLLQQQQQGKHFKPSCKKSDETLEFAPVNLHLQRMWAHNDTLKRAGILDIITVGAFTRHTGKSKTGGLVKLLQQIKDAAAKGNGNALKVASANDAVQAIKQLRKEIVEIMSQLLFLAKSKNPKGMLPLCNEMMTKTRALLNIWEPSLVEEAFAFIERHRIVEDQLLLTDGGGGAAGAGANGTSIPMSPFKKITQQLGALDLKSPELEDFSTPMGPAPDLWPQVRTSKSGVLGSFGSGTKTKSPSSVDISTIATIQNTFNQLSNGKSKEYLMSCSLPAACYLPTEQPKGGRSKRTTPTEPMSLDGELKFSETHFDINGDVTTDRLAKSPEDEKGDELSTEACPRASLSVNQLLENKNELLSNVYDENGYLIENTAIVLGHNGAFLDTKVMSSSPSANYYRPTEEPEPLDLTQLNIEASVMCLVSKVKFLCGRCGSPAVRLRQPKGCNAARRGGTAGGPFAALPPDVVTSQPLSLPYVGDGQEPEQDGSLNAANGLPKDLLPGPSGKPPLCSKDLNLALTQAVGEVTRKVKKGNKFTDGLDLSMTTDWASELRPSMKKLRQAMDGLLKTARLMHSVQRLQQDMKQTSAILAVMYRRDVCFSQALTAVTSALMAKLWGQNVTENYINLLCNLGPLAYFEGLLSLYGSETDMWGDMSVAIGDLATVSFTLVRSNIQRDSKAGPVPRVTGSRQAITVLMPVPESVFCHLPTKEGVSFKITPVFFNIGINEKATLAETLGYTKEQHRINWENYDKLKQFHIRYKKIPFNFVNPSCSAALDTPTKVGLVTAQQKEALVPEHAVVTLLNEMEDQLRVNCSKNYRVLTLAEDICRAMQGLRFTSCKSAKDRTSMGVTLEQCRVLQQEFHLSSANVQIVLDTMRRKPSKQRNDTTSWISSYRCSCNKKVDHRSIYLARHEQRYQPIRENMSAVPIIKSNKAHRSTFIYF
ncbi:type II inositol 3,4-bisphosphate 4-phosphatase isoform X3 [Toxorhynchites rutilus septentrionalis]|uniref:type II inositol 3,4-bisphosphate 4-phosphatase isoform X3 n=1 Tax=Toxorhynchites rutilus septentrionalis TaxID=329112 RepID=UPI0024794D75|nr:type II inositol 3,4-bisphosphate 4-phosphatase isoform X3 [Toxorhynchites rutilus septentrionalis]